jgi:predicted ester cyclase
MGKLININETGIISLDVSSAKTILNNMGFKVANIIKTVLNPVIDPGSKVDLIITEDGEVMYVIPSKVDIGEGDMSSTMSIEAENKDLIRRFWNELSRGNLAIIDEFCADNFIRYATDRQEMDKEGYKNLCSQILTNIPDVHFTLDDIVAEGNRAAFRFTWAGTVQSAAMNGSLKGKHISITEDYFCRIENGKIVEFTNLFDRLSYFEQAGITPPSQ